MIFRLRLTLNPQAGCLGGGCGMRPQACARVGRSEGMDPFVSPGSQDPTEQDGVYLYALIAIK